MALYRYIKSPPQIRSNKKSKTVASLVLIGLGGSILLWVLWPILSFTLISEELFSKTIVPVEETAGAVGSLSPMVLAAQSQGESEAANAADFTNANFWYPTLPQKKVITPVNTYTITIPRLKITDAMVTVAGDDLNTSLIHYGGTSLPGQYGNTVIFGHSTLPQFFNAKNYKTIFSTLPTLKIGDDVFITYDGINYRYVVDELIVNDPNDVSTLEQKFDDSYLTLVTCVPPGTYWKRLNVKAKLRDI